MECKVPGFMVAAEEGDAVGVFDLETEEIFEGFNGMVAAIHEVADEDVAGLFNFSS
jgi:hypothetical protein